MVWSTLGAIALAGLPALAAPSLNPPFSFPGLGCARSHCWDFVGLHSVAPISHRSKIRERRACPGDLENLASLMLRDLPSYANRVLRRSRILDVPDDNYTFSALIAGRAEYEPLDLSTIPESQIESIQDPNPPEQIFFTTLEQHYTDKKTYTTQNYHWLFIVKSDRGWQPVLLFTQFGSSVPGKFPTPPRETSNGIVGQAIKIWLRDCRAGSIDF